jgi:putative aminopeptidase FrvX
METQALLESLSDTFGVAGFEDDVREAIRRIVTPLGDDVREDALGNLIVTKRGRVDRAVMLDAHMDEIGLIINHVEDGGFLRFATIGGWDARILPAQGVTIRTRSGVTQRGVIGTLPPHLLKAEEREKPVPVDAMFIDIGAASAAEVAARGVRIGDPATLAYPCRTLSGGCLMGKAFDDRVGCVVMIKVLEALAGRTPQLTVACNFAVAEEIGLRGARTAAFQIDPAIALAIEGTVAADIPGVAGARQVTRLGHGPAVSLADNTVVVRPRLVQAIERIAAAHEIPYQHKAPLVGGTDAGAIHVSRAGVLAGVISVPCRYIHTPLSLLRLSDVDAAIRLVTAFVEAAHTLVG